MDATVEDLGVVVVAAMRAAGYTEVTIRQYGKTIKLLGLFVKERGGVYSSVLGAQFAALTTSPRTARFSPSRRWDYGRVVAVFDALVDTGQVVLTRQCRGSSAPRPRSPEFIAVDGAWEADMVDRGLGVSTRDSYGRAARDFLVYLEGQGVTRLDDVRASMMPGFLTSLLDRWAESALCGYVSYLRPFLVFVRRPDLVDAVKLAGLRRPRHVVPVIAEEDVARVVDVCSTPGKVTARDAALTLLGLTTGLRACDIIALRLGDIDWRAQTVSLVQQKTGNPVVLPLTDLVVGRLADYVLSERPRVDDDHVFLRRIAPHTPLACYASVDWSFATVFTAAGVSMSGLGACTRLLRHTAATRLLRAGTPLPVISAVLGHAQPESTSVYLTVDDERLRSCVLPVPAGALS